MFALLACMACQQVKFLHVIETRIFRFHTVPISLIICRLPFTIE